MNVKKVIAIEDVHSDLNIGERFYESSEAGIGIYFRDCIIADIESLTLYAGIHSKHFGFYRMLSARFPYAIYYDIRGETAIVVAVLDMRRDPSWIGRILQQRKR